MYINEQYKHLELTIEKKYICIKRDGEIVNEENTILREHTIGIYVNEILTMKVVCTPQYLIELVLGRLFTEGIIETIEDIEVICICESGNCARVTLSNKELEKEGSYIEIVPTYCTENQVLNDSFVKKRNIHPLREIKWKKEWIFAMADRMADGMLLHSETWGTHSCFLSKEGEILFACEDIGRHNALDKVIGYALRNHIVLEKCAVYSSGRIPADMAKKVIQAGIPVLASKAVPTKEAIELAEEYGLTLICSARRDRMKVYTDFYNGGFDGLILAGGKSSRMNGQHKGNLMYGAETFMCRLIKELEKDAAQIWISYSENIHETYKNCRIVTDEYPDCGPIGGIHAGLKVCRAELLFVAACDMPFLKIEFFRYLEEKMKQEETLKGIKFDAVVPVLKERINPLAAIYRKSAINILEQQIGRKKYRIRDSLELMNVLYIDISDRKELEQMLQNINTVEEYQNLIDID